ncbi:MAG: hypothetical protein HYU99_01540 [Deltaproteobacteria bacterium]|nr:hypothetical protein [Deltaproteobacteria bacterium]
MPPVKPEDSYQAAFLGLGGVALRQSVPTAARLAAPTALEQASAVWGTDAAILDGGIGAEMAAGEGLLTGALRLAVTFARFSPLALIFMESDRPRREKPIEPAQEVYQTVIETVGVPDYEAWKKWSEMEKHRRAIRWIETEGKRLKQSDGWTRRRIEKYLEDNGLTLEGLYAFENPLESYEFKLTTSSGNNPPQKIDRAGQSSSADPTKEEKKRRIMDSALGAEPPSNAGKNLGQRRDSQRLQTLEKKVRRIGADRQYFTHSLSATDGGLKNIFSIIVDGRTWGIDEGFDTWFVTMGHGHLRSPFYVVISRQALMQGNDIKSTDAFIAYVVPEACDRDFLRRALDEAVAENLISPEYAEREKAKIVTYEEFVAKEGVSK